MTGGVSASTGSVSSYYGSSPTAQTSSTELDKNAFLKLLVAQLKYQDPSKPADMSQFLAETAQFTLVERFEQLADVNSSMLATNRAAAAVALVGRTVSWTTADGTTRSGVVTGVSVAGDQTTLEIGSTTIPLDAVTRVQPTAATPPATGSEPETPGTSST
jgi:flagellar hook assembly protein FlgD